MNAISYRWKLSNLHRSRRRTRKAYEASLVKAKKVHKPRKEIEGLIDEMRGEIAEIDDEIEALRSRHLIELARRLGLPLPECNRDSEMWEESPFTGRSRLSKRGMMELQGVIRTEKKERRRTMMELGTAITGIIRALAAWWRF